MSDSLTTPRTVAHQAPLSMEFPRQEHWSGLPFSSPGDLPGPEMEPVSPALVGFFTLSHQENHYIYIHTHTHTHTHSREEKEIYTDSINIFLKKKKRVVFIYRD